MGTQLSLPEREITPDPFWPKAQTQQVASSNLTEKQKKEEDEVQEGAAAEDERADHEVKIRHEDNQKKLEVFKQEMADKREARHKAIAALTDKLKQLQAEIKAEHEGRIAAEAENKRLKSLLEEDGMKDELDRERRRIDDLEEELKKEKEEKDELYKDREKLEERENQIRALREVASIGKDMLRIRELQVNELKKKLCETAYPGDLREEYETQIQNVRRLKTLYEERAEAVRVEHQRELERDVARIKLLEKRINELEREKEESELMKDHLKSQVLKLDQALEEQTDKSMTLREQLDASVLECKDLSSQMSLINNIFSQVLLGNIDADRLTRLLQENQSLMTDLTSNEEKNDLAALLLNIAGQVDDPSNVSTANDTTTKSDNDNENNGKMTQEDVALNLTKVWRILVQLLAKDSTSPSDCDSDSCYKSVNTPSGPRSVISVSQTFLTLKTLILEKNALIKEVGRLKSLNGHLDTRLGNQEKRLSIVSTELKKTWGVVSKLRAQHKQLHTQEKILRYELQHKRQLLSELKEELERCRDKWDMARKKNCQSEKDWRELRREFAERKNRQVSNSAESGYEDDESHSPPTEESMDEHDPSEETDLNSPEQIAEDITEQEEEELDFTESIDYINIMKDQETLEEIPIATLLDANIENDDRCKGDTEIDVYKVTVSQPTSGENHVGCRPNQEIQKPQEELSRLHNENGGDITKEVVEEVTTSSHEEPFKSSRLHDGNFNNDNDDNDLSLEINNRLLSLNEVPCNDEIPPDIGRPNSPMNQDPSTRMHETLSTEEHQPIPEIDNSQRLPSLDEVPPCTETPSPSPVKIKPTKILRTPCSAENISRFLDGLIAPSQESYENTSSNHPPDLNPCNEICTTDEETEVSNQSSLPDVCNRTSAHSCLGKKKEVRFSDITTTADIPLSNDPQDTTDCVGSRGEETDRNGKLHYCIGQSEENTHLTDDEKSLKGSDELAGKNSECLTNETTPTEMKPPDTRTTEEVLDARTARLKRLEEQCKSLFNKVTATTHKSNALSTKLDVLHEQYGGSTSSSGRLSRTETFDDVENATGSTNSKTADDNNPKP